MKRIVFAFLGTLMLWTSGCMKMSDNITCIGSNNPIPAIFTESSSDIDQPALMVRGGILVAEELQNNTELKDGDALLTLFCVNYDQQISKNYTTVYNFEYKPVDQGFSQPTDDGQTEAGDFDLPIEKMAYVGRVGNILFFAFEHKNSSEQGFVYEMTYDRNETNDPTAYFRAKSAEQSLEKDTKYGYYAFDVNSFFEQLDQESENLVKFKIQYKVGVDEEGNDEYKNCQNPLNNSTTFVFRVE